MGEFSTGWTGPGGFAPGQRVRKREVWDGRVWLEHDVEVVSDDGAEPDGVLAVLLTPGTPFTFPEHPGGPHPWSRQSAWEGPTMLQLRRADEWHSVWLVFHEPGRLDHWYVNFERPLERTDQGLDTDDLELDLVLRPDGTRVWKDVEQLHQRVEEGRFGVPELLGVLREAEVVVDRLDRDDRWWSPWDGWTPAQRMAPGR